MNTSCMRTQLLLEIMASITRKTLLSIRDNGNDDVSLKPRRAASTKARCIVAMVTLNGVINNIDETHGTVIQRRLLVIG